MVRKWISIGEVSPYSYMHFKSDNEYGFDVREENDGQSLEEHLVGIDYIASVVNGGQKTTPILIEETATGFRVLDGFKRFMAYKKLGRPIIECFVPTAEEINQKKQFTYLGLTMEATLGGQSYFETRIPLIEGKDNVVEPSLEEIDTLYHGEHIRIEYSECFHIHFGHFGKYRIKCGIRDFIALCDAFEQWGK